jgi:preprotein translocase subunit SecA
MSDAPLKIDPIPGAYPERIDSPVGWLDRAGSRAASPFLRWRRLAQLGTGRFVDSVASHASWAAGLDNEQIRSEAERVGEEARRFGLRDPLVARSFALIREVAYRTIGQRHFDVQLMGGRVLLHGLVAEMQTGEGKTLTATLAASTAALAGIPVHIITVNDYLANRDAELMGPIYRALGLTVGTIIHDLDPEARRRAYACDLAYCSNKEIAFDYLKDRIVLGREAGRVKLLAERLYNRRPRMDQLLLRGLFYGIVDEADSVLIDEARTPLIISGANANDSFEEQTCKTALTLAAQMEVGRDFSIEGRDRAIVLLTAGLERLAAMTEALGTVWNRRRWREELVRQALAAVHLFKREKQYLVKNDKVQIIDEYTGRMMADRSWEHGLQQMIEAKEGCPVTQRMEPLARISYQRFFRRYLWLAGMTGTAREVKGELWKVYRLATSCIPTNRPTKRQRWSDRIYPTQDEKWNAVVKRIAQIHALGRPLLVGTRSVEASERLSRLLADAGLDHQLLNARQDAEEATIIAAAGRTGRITVATNMAGRGTDIRLAPDALELGGLHVIATELHESRRIDRQLFGRCGRQGDAGTCEAIISLEDELAQVYSHRFLRMLGRYIVSRGLSSRGLVLTFRMAQRSAERLHLRMRRDLLEIDEQLDSTLAFSGKSE